MQDPELKAVCSRDASARPPTLVFDQTNPSVKNLETSRDGHLCLGRLYRHIAPDDPGSLASRPILSPKIRFRTFSPRLRKWRKLGNGPDDPSDYGLDCRCATLSITPSPTEAQAAVNKLESTQNNDDLRFDQPKEKGTFDSKNEISGVAD